MHVPPNTLVTLGLDPAAFALELAPGGAGEISGAVVARADGRRVARFRQNSLEERAPEGHVHVDIEDPAVTLPDAILLVAVLLFTEHHADAHLHRPHDWCFVHGSTARRYQVAHPPRIEAVQALLARLPVATRVRLLVEACELAVPIWRDWAETGDLTYFDGVMAMDAVPRDLAEATIAAVKQWLDDADPAPLEAFSGAYRRLHWPMLEDEWVIPHHVYYSLFAPCNLARCALAEGDLSLAQVCMQQATAARATNGADEFLGEPYRRAFLLAWWRACLGELCR